eukprot:6218261-Prymnesium_polylepis.1
MAGDGLSVVLDGVTILERVELVLFEPTLSWRFGFGARVGSNANQRAENHDVRNFAVMLGAPVAPVPLLPELSLNGQQYVSNGTYTYYAAA